MSLRAATPSLMLPGLRVGHAHCERSRTGVTVLIPDRPVVMACDVRGGGPGTRETDALEPTTLVERVHGLVLSGGSVFGLEAAGEVALLLARSGRGLALSDGLFVPVVPSAILFDLANGGDKGWARKGWALAGGAEPPYRLLARKAMAALGSDAGEGALGSDDGEGAHGSDDGEGAIGAGFGARAGSRAGGIGVARALLDGGGSVATLIAVNCFGEVTDGAPPVLGAVPFPKRRTGADLAAASTCIGAVVTDIALSRAAAKRMAMMAHDGLARTIRPIHTPFDGDAIFAIGLSPETPAMVDPLLLAELGTRAADCVALAVRRAVALANP